MKTLYPEIEPYAVHSIKVNKIHHVYVEECGNASGIPVLFLHGGPASGCKPDHRRFFNPELYRIVLFDQRGCGRSKPHGKLENNTTQDLVSDMEHLRVKLGIDRWLLFGGSWGAALSLLYAQNFPDKVSAMILRGIFLARHHDLEWFLKDGANRIYPEQWQRLVSAIPKSDNSDLISAMESCLWGKDELAQLRVAKEWDAWGGQVALGTEYDPTGMDEHVTAEILRRVRIEMHYAKHRYFLEDNQILEHCDRLTDIPAVIIHGRNDLVCPMESAYSLHKKLPKAKFIVLPNSGHVAHSNEMINALIRTMDRIAKKVSR